MSCYGKVYQLFKNGIIQLANIALNDVPKKKKKWPLVSIPGVKQPTHAICETNVKRKLLSQPLPRCLIHSGPSKLGEPNPILPDSLEKAQ